MDKKSNQYKYADEYVDKLCRQAKGLARELKDLNNQFVERRIAERRKRGI